MPFMASIAKKIDYKREYRALYSARRLPGLIEVPPLNYLMVDGTGGPYGAAYRAAVEALFAVSYSIKFAIRRESGVDFGVMPLESLWPGKVSSSDKASWDWTAMIMQPDPVTAAVVDAARAETTAKKGLPAVASIRFEELAEGAAAQILHVGPYDAEDPTIAALADYIGDNGLKATGAHHEIYLNNPERAAADRLRTIIRQPAG